RTSHRGAEQGENAEVHDGVGGDEPERWGADRLPHERAGERGGSVKGPASEGVDHQKPDRYHEPGQDSTDYAVGDPRLRWPLHGLGLLAMRSRQYRPRWHPRNHAEPIHYGLLTGRFSILVHDARLGVTSRAAPRPARGVPARYARAARPPRGPGRSPGRPRQRPRGARRAATRDAQNPRVRRVVRVLGRVAPRGRNGGDGQGLGRPARRRGRGPWRPRPLVRRPAGRGAEPRGPRHTEWRPPRDRPPPGDAAAGGRRARPRRGGGRGRPRPCGAARVWPALPRLSLRVVPERA